MKHKPGKSRPDTTWKKIWYFIWEDNSIWSWIVNIIISFVLIKYIIYPVLGLALSTTHPIVAVVSGSMEHDGSFDSWWDSQQHLYSRLNITKEEFQTYPFKNGFNTGDIMILYGKVPEDIEKGDILVFWGSRSDPIIHRVVAKAESDDSVFFYTKGDHNLGSNLDEMKIPAKRVVGYDKYDEGSVAIFRIPFLGYIKIVFVKIAVCPVLYLKDRNAYNQVCG